jgi:hypothetical protein
MPKREPDKENKSIVVESSLELFHLSESNEFLFIIKHDQKTVLKTFLSLDIVLAVIKRHLFEGSEGKVTVEEYNSDPKQGGNLLSEEIIKAEEVISNEQLQPLLDIWLVETVMYVVKWLPSKLSELLGQLQYEAALNFISHQEKTDEAKTIYVSGKTFRITKEHLIAKPAKSERDNIVVDEFLRKEREQIKQRLGVKGRGGSTAEYDLNQLSKRFEETYKIIDDAKRIYKNNRNDKRWREFILKEYPDLPADLLERLSKSPNLSDEIWAKLSEKGGASAASDLALEYAARLCGAPLYHYTLRHLKDTLAEQGMSVKKVKSKGSH